MKTKQMKNKQKKNYVKKNLNVIKMIPILSLAAVQHTHVPQANGATKKYYNEFIE